ncbi:hypothetical protein KAR91_67865 [Candidatus Pacearchaeota archaeon]|nr:hypothetical protein [Candidatus Pacearchaeota archaeon]
MTTVEMLEKAAEAIKQLIGESEGVVEKLAHHKRAQTLGFSLLKEGAILVDDLENRIEEFAEKTAEEIVVLEKAAELVTESNGSFSFGKLDDASNANDLPADEQFFLGLLDQ